MKTADRIQNVEEYYFSKKLKEIAEMSNSKTEKNVINLGIGCPDLSPPVAVLNKLAVTCQTKGVHGYQPYRGITELRKAFSNYYEKLYGVVKDENDEIVPLMGSKEGIMHISLAFVNKGDSVLIPEIGYLTYTSVSKLCEAEIIAYPISESNWMPNLNKLNEMPKQVLSKTKLMWINYPNMPTGAYPDVEILAKLIEWCQENDILLINDNPYNNVGYNDKFSIFQIKGAEYNCLELNSLSKSHNMSGFRMGVLIANKQIIDAILRVKTNFDSGMYLPIQQAAITALETENEWYEKNANKYRQRYRIANKIIEALNCKKASYQGGLFLWSKLNSDYNSSEKFVDMVLKKYRIFITPGFIFGDKGNEYIRISLCSPIEVLNEALKRINSNKL